MHQMLSKNQKSGFIVSKNYLDLPEDLLEQFDLVVGVLFGILLLQKCPGISHGPSIHLRRGDRSRYNQTTNILSNLHAAKQSPP